MRYDECSNGQLKFVPFTDDNVNNGVITVMAPINLSTQNWGQCGKIALDATSDISANYKMIVCPNEVDFYGAAAWGQRPGTVSWYKSQYASTPIVQVHEVVSKACHTSYHH